MAIYTPQSAEYNPRTLTAVQTDAISDIVVDTRDAVAAPSPNPNGAAREKGRLQKRPRELLSDTTAICTPETRRPRPNPIYTERHGPFDLIIGVLLIGLFSLFRRLPCRPPTNELKPKYGERRP
ncbi:hypothetical protein AB1N83_001016 [Pleurotus pulmonarius]